MSLRKHLFAGILASSMALGGSAAIAQDSTPMASPDADRGEITLVSPEGNPVGMATFNETEEGLSIAVTSDGDSGLEPGEHGVHLAEDRRSSSGSADSPS